jgi:NAD+ kinase
MRLGIIVNVRRPGAEATVTLIENWAKEHGWPVTALGRIDMVADPDFRIFPEERFGGQVDLLLALGGDGTMLTAVRTVATLGIPVLGVNLGALGFLTVVPPHECRDALDRIKDGNYTVEERLMLEVSETDTLQKGVSWAALNDVVIIKGGMSRMVKLTVTHNGEYVSSFAGDGLIVATPTGSTAYSLSVGGPILMPSMQGFVLTPISPHTLAQRPMVFDASARLEITLDAVAEDTILTVDGQLARHLSEKSTLVVSRSHDPARLVSFPDRPFFRLLREKLHWGIGPALHQGEGVPEG